MHSKTHKPSNTNSPEVLTLSGRSDVFDLQNVQTEAMPPFLTRIKAAHFTGFCSSIKGSYRGVENVNETVIKLTARFVNLTELQIMSPLYHPSFASHSLSLSVSLCQCRLASSQSVQRRLSFQSQFPDPVVQWVK